MIGISLRESLGFYDRSPVGSLVSVSQEMIEYHRTFPKKLVHHNLDHERLALLESNQDHSLGKSAGDQNSTITRDSIFVEHPVGSNGLRDSILKFLMDSRANDEVVSHQVGPQ